MKILAIIAVIVFIIGEANQVVHAEVSSGSYYYVSPSGSDTNQGTQNKPWLTVQKAVSSANPGDTIFLMGGTYHESVKIQRTGTSASPIRLTNFQGQVATIDGGANPSLTLYTSTPQYWIVEGLKLLSSGTFTVQYDSWGCKGTCAGIDHWTFRNNYISGAVRIYGAYTLFEGNEVDGTNNNGNGGNAIWDLYDVSHHNIFRNNTVHNFTRRGFWSMHRTHDDIFDRNLIHDIGMNTGATDGICIDTDGMGTVEWRHTITNNTMYRCGIMGISLENTFASVIQDNSIGYSGTEGIVIINYGATLSPGVKSCEVGGEYNQYGDTDGNNDCEGNITGNKIFQNLIYRSGTDTGIRIKHAGGVEIYGNTIAYGTGKGISLDAGVTFCPQISIRNNVLAMNKDAQISLKDFAALSVDDHNLFYVTNPQYVYMVISTAYSLPGYQTAASKGTGSKLGNPNFADPTKDDYRPLAGSPLIDAGVDIGLAVDINGNLRPQGSGYDIGAFEVSVIPDLHKVWIAVTRN